MTTTRCCSRRAARPTGACSRRAGSMPSARSIPDAPMYTFWDYMRKRWERDAGLRLDQILLTPDLHERLVEAGVDRTVRGKPNASDHAPVWVVLRDGGKRSAKARGTTAAQASPPSRQRRIGAPPNARKRTRPLLVIDGDSFAHRAYHALPKTIMRAGQQARGRHPRLRELPAEILSERAAARRAGGLGYAHRGNLSARKLSRLPERTRL